jgi:2-dehydro-3-deoxygalactonokinase
MREPKPAVRRAIALDGGTTNTRARLVADGRIVATARRAVGVRDSALGGGPVAVFEAVRACLDEVERLAGGPVDRIVAAGMLTSAVGLRAVPHIEAPAGLDELARGVASVAFPEMGGRVLALVTGVKTPPAPGPDGWAEADVMRGEECETLGAWLLRGRPAGPRAYLWPGSHTKLVAFDGGRITRSVTTLAGELWSAVASQTLLKASLPQPPDDPPDPEALELGRRLVERHGLGRAAFAVRLADLQERLGPEARAAFWLGAVIAEDVDRLARHPILDGAIPVVVGGRQPQRDLYARWLAERHGGPIETLDDAEAEAASALGALAIAERTG